MIKYNIYGFSQSMLIKYGLDVIDALLLRYFVDFKNSGKMIKEKFHGEDYYWIDYKSVIEYIPIINITTNNALRRRLRKLEDCNMLKHHTKVCKGCYSFYTLGENYPLLESAFKSAKKFKGSCTKVVPPSDEKPEQKIQKLNTYAKKDIYNICSAIIDYLNEKADKRYRATNKSTRGFIVKRLEEGFKVKDFFKVIDTKTSQWKNTNMDKFLRPQTLFGENFEGYLNEKNKEGKKSGQSTVFEEPPSGIGIKV